VDALAEGHPLWHLVPSFFVDVLTQLQLVLTLGVLFGAVVWFVGVRDNPYFVRDRE